MNWYECKDGQMPEDILTINTYPCEEFTKQQAFGGKTWSAEQLNEAWTYYRTEDVLVLCSDGNIFRTHRSKG